MLSKICNILSYILIICLLIIAGLLFVPRILGYEVLAVVSGSMEPTISVGSLVYAKDIDFSDYKVGDIVTYRLSDETLVTHRVVEVNSDGTELTMKGDANQTNDGIKVNDSNVVGKVMYHLPLLGYLSLYVTTPLGIVMVCIIIFILILLLYLPEVFTKEENT